MRPIPRYVQLYEAGELEDRVAKGYEMLKSCNLCARNCGVNRLEDEKGFCNSGSRIMVSSAEPHFGEEPPLVGRYGSGTIFFTNCNLRCVLCQNYYISQLGEGQEIESEQLAGIMLELQKAGCHNINFVSPTHYIPQILDSLLIAVKSGLRIPLVHNCGGYESIESLKLLDGVFDIYMPDIKYGDNDMGEKYSNAPNYFDVVTAAVSEMHRQVGDLGINQEGIAERGLLIRHLVLPGNLAGTEKVVEFVSRLSKNTYINIMAQYRPQNKASDYPELNRMISSEEFMNAISLAEKAGLRRGFPRGQQG